MAIKNKYQAKFAASEHGTYTGIGSRKLTDAGKQAIVDLYSTVDYNYNIKPNFRRMNDGIVEL